jgi:carbon monoxide dehydrogenase subunit G
MSQIVSKGLIDGVVTNSKLNVSSITGQTAETVADNADLILIYDDSGTALKKMTRANFLSGVAALAEQEVYVLSAGNITAGYIDCGFASAVNTAHLTVKGQGGLIYGASYDYTAAPTGGVGSVLRVTWLNDLATGGAAALVAGDVIQVSYIRA